MRLGRGNCPLPLCLIPPLLERVRLEQLLVILVVFNCCLVLWYTKISQMLADQPWMIPQICEALSQEVGCDRHVAHPGLVAAGLALEKDRLRLAGWTVLLLWTHHPGGLGRIHHCPLHGQVVGVLAVV